MVDQEEFLRKVLQHLNNPQDDAANNELQSLIKQSALNKRVYDQIIFIWNSSAGLQKLDQLDDDAAVIELEAKLAELQHYPAETVTGKFNIKRWVAIAAILLLGAVTYWQYSQQAKINFVVKTTNSTIDSVTLADGSKIYLDAHSEIKYPTDFKNGLREISLRSGQAFFKIHRDTLHPFIVEIRHSSVTVLGTSFNIDSHGNQIALNVTTGKVKFQPIADNDNGSILHAGTGLIYDEINNKEIFLTAVTHNNQYWLTKEIDFVDASLVEVCKQLEECYKVKISIVGNHSSFKKFNAHFKDNKLDNVLEVLRDTYPIKIKQMNNGSIIIQNALK